MGLNSYQVTFESCGDHYQIYGRDIQDVMGSVTGGAGVYVYGQDGEHDGYRYLYIKGRG